MYTSCLLSPLIVLPVRYPYQANTDAVAIRPAGIVEEGASTRVEITSVLGTKFHSGACDLGYGPAQGFRTLAKRLAMSEMS